MAPIPNGVRWTPKMFEKLVERYVFRTKITEDFKKAISMLNEDHLVNKENGLKLLKLLFEKESEMKEIYGTPEELMRDLFDYQNIPCNAELLGLKDSLNYDAILNTFEISDPTRHEVCSIADAYAAFVRVIIEPKYKFASLLAKSIGNWIGRYKKNSFDLTSCRFVDDLASHEEEVRSKMKFDHDFEKETIEEVYAFLSQYYNEEEDANLLNKLRKMLDDENERIPIAKNLEHYKKICACHASFDASIKKTFITPSIVNESFLDWRVPVVRLFIDVPTSNLHKRFFFAKELEYALVIAMKKHHDKEFPKGLFPVETEEDRKFGILKVVNWQTYNNVLKILKLPTDGVLVIGCKIEKTSREIQIPINSPYGTYCVLASHAFSDVFAQVTIGMQLFRRVNEENAPKILEWFKNLDVFSESRRYTYFIETWKVDEIINRAYKELQQYSTEEIYNLSDSHYGKHDAIEELFDLSPNFPNQKVLRFHYERAIKNAPNKKFSSRHLLFIYERSMIFALVDVDPKIALFFANQNLGNKIRETMIVKI